MCWQCTVGIARACVKAQSSLDTDVHLGRGGRKVPLGVINKVRGRLPGGKKFHHRRFLKKLNVERAGGGLLRGGHGPGNGLIAI